MMFIEIKVKSGLSVAVIFIENIMIVMLTDVRKKIREEVEELVLEEFYFLLNWGLSIGCLQEIKMVLIEVFYEGNILMLYEIFRLQNFKRKVIEDEEVKSCVDVDILGLLVGKVGKVFECLVVFVLLDIKYVLLSIFIEGK